MIYAASSSTYGDSKALPKVEDNIGKPLSPYAVTKYVNELYADVFGKTYNTEVIGLRYFNVFGPKQSPNGAYAAVIPLFMQALKDNNAPKINGDGEQTRDFTFVDNAVQANILAATTTDKRAVNNVYNVALGDRTSLNELYKILQDLISKKNTIQHDKLVYRDFRDGDVRHSQADITKAKKLLGYRPTHKVLAGLKNTVEWHLKNTL